jgi:hypothetical protein
MSCCPSCTSRRDVYIYDSGMKLVRRLLILNNRFACRRCKVTWRRRERYGFFDLKDMQAPQVLGPSLRRN